MFVISEISPQFGPDLGVAEQMILQSKMGGADAVKVQLYPTELFFPDGDPYVKSRELDFDGFKRLHDYAERVGIPLFATAFTEDRLEWCLAVGQRYYKVAARQHRENPDLVRRILAVGRPTFVSVPHDMDPSQVRREAHCCYLFCIPKYPTLVEEVALPSFRDTLYDGISDHTLGVAAALAAAAHGAQVLEKHFTISYSWQRSNEKAHLGAMTLEDLRLIKTVAADFGRMRLPG
jgi:sialic acid synthase SpsE